VQANYGYSGAKGDMNVALVLEFVAEAEKRYGSRVPDIGVDVMEGDGPHTQFFEGRKHATVRIPLGLKDFDRRGQLAHEAIHVFSPADLDEATYLDEGVAAIFAAEIQNYYPPQDKEHLMYWSALSVSACLIQMHPTSIQELMKRCVRLARVKSDDILAVCPSFPKVSAHFLARKFYR
jgi:hypothetical protein